MKWIDRILEKIGLQRRSDAGFSDKWYPMSGLGGMSAAGQNVNESTAMNISAVWCAVHLISHSFMGLPVSAYERLAGGGRNPLPKHPVTRLLSRRPNSFMAASMFEMLLTQWAAIWGAGYAEIERGASGEALALWPIHPSRVTVEWNPAAMEPVYRVRTEGKGPVMLPHAKVLKIMAYTRDGYTPVSVLEHARDSMGLTLATEQHGSYTFKNGATPPLVIEWPGTFGTDDEAIAQFRKQWHTAYGGENTGSVAVLEQDMKAHVLGMPNDDAQFLETRQFQLTEIARWFNITPSKLHDLLRATYSNIEQLSLDFAFDTLLPWVIRWRDECALKLFSEAEQETHYVHYNLDSLLQTDFKTRWDGHRIQFETGHLSINEIRALEDLNPLEGDVGELRVVPANMTPVEKLMEPEPEPQPIPPQLVAPVADPEEEPEEEDRADVIDIFAPLVVGALERCARKESKAVEAARKRCDGCDGKLEVWGDTFYTRHADEIADKLVGILEAVQRCAGIAGADVSTPARILARGRCMAGRFALGISAVVDHDNDADARALLGAWSKSNEQNE